MKILFVHQNYPAQFRYLAPALQKIGHDICAMSMNKYIGTDIVVHQYLAQRSSTADMHPWVSDFETKVIRAEAAYKKALELKKNGYEPDLIIAHPGWGESMFLKNVWPKSRLAIYCEFYYHPVGADVGFDPEFPMVDPGDSCKINLKNLNNLMHFEVADAGIAPTHWQASVFPDRFKEKITVVHDGIDTQLIKPNKAASIKLNAHGKEVVLSYGDEVVTFVNRNLEPYRGYHIFMRALPKLLAERPNARVLIVGGDGVSYGAKSSNDKSWKSIFFDEVKNLLTPAQINRIHFLGNVPYNYFIPLLQISAAHVYLTYPFVLSWSLIESMSAACPIIASDTAPLREAIVHERNGILVDFFNPDALADAMIEMLGNPSKARALGNAARASAIKNYDLKTVCLPKQISWVESLLIT